MRAYLAVAAVVVALATPSVASADLTNLDHLDYLGDAVTPPAQAGHTTYGDAPIGVLWTYADAQSGGGFERIGGGSYDAATNTYGQGAFNADDIARAAVVYTRHWRPTRSASIRALTGAQTRGLAYLQTASGPNAGNVVLWMQPDGTLRPRAEPREEPDPSDRKSTRLNSSHTDI